MPNGGKIFISTDSVQIDAGYVKKNPEAKPGSFVRLSVADTGCGMEANVLNQIFEPFFTTKEVGKGTGLGLSTVYGIVKQLEGWIEVLSQVGLGSKFTVILPCTNEIGSSNDTQILTRKPRQGKETLLVVEDETAVRELTHQVLESHGYRILVANTGPEAMQIWRQRKNDIDLLLTDMVMPGGLTGRELAEKLQAEKRDLKVICMSGYSVELSGKNITGDAGFNFLPKPFDMLKLVETVRNCLEQTSVAVN